MSMTVIRPSGAGDYENIVQSSGCSAGSHWQCVDEAVTDDGTTYLRQDNTGQQKDALALENPDIPAGATIDSVTVVFRARDNVADQGTAQPFLRLSGGETAGTAVNLTGSWATYRETLARPGGGAWSVADLNALQAVIGLARVGATDQADATQIYCEVRFTRSRRSGLAS